MKAGGDGQNARQHYLETKEQHLWERRGGWCSSGIQHADGSRLWGGEGDVPVCVRENRWIYLSPRALQAPSMPQFRSLQLISLTSGLTLEAEADISLVLLISAAWRARGGRGRVGGRSSPSLLRKEGIHLRHEAQLTWQRRRRDVTGVGRWIISSHHSHTGLGGIFTSEHSPSF